LLPPDNEAFCGVAAKYEAPLTRYEAPLTRYEAPLTRYEAPLTRYEANSQSSSLSVKIYPPELNCCLNPL